MKKIGLILLFLFAGNIIMAQGLFDALEDIDEISSVVVTKDAFQLLQKFPDAQSEDMEVFNMLKGLEELKIFSTDEVAIADKMESMVDKAIGGKKLTQLMRVKDKGSSVKIYVKATKDKDIVSEVLMFAKDLDGSKQESVIISLLGDIDVNKLSQIANKYQKRDTN